MTDRREIASNGRVAHMSLKGHVAADRFVDGETASVEATISDLLSAPGGVRERQLVRGEQFKVLEVQGGHAFGYAERDGYVGWIAVSDVDGAPGTPPPTHAVAVRQTYAKASASLKATEEPVHLSFGSRLTVTGDIDGWSRTIWSVGGEEGGSTELFVPPGHLRKLSEPMRDPVDVANLFLGTPYLWGGNSAFGLDCSGLVQAAMLACGIPCPGDSDQQAARLGEALGDGQAPKRGDVWFWDGHVGILSQPDRLLHANAHHMAVVEEPLDEAVERIRQNEGLDVSARRRVNRPDE